MRCRLRVILAVPLCTPMSCQQLRPRPWRGADTAWRALLSPLPVTGRGQESQAVGHSHSEPRPAGAGHRVTRAQEQTPAT